MIKLETQKKLQLSDKILTICLSVLFSVLTCYGVAHLNKSPSVATQTQTVNVNTKDKGVDNRININTCSKEALESLSGIGDKLAESIIKKRPYTDIHELSKVNGIDTGKIKTIEGMVKVE